MNSLEVQIPLDDEQMAEGVLRWDDGESILPEDVSTSNYWDVHFVYLGNSNSGWSLSVNALKSTVVQR